jgi:hypothetical protein
MILKARRISSGDRHMTPVREGLVSGPIHRLQFFDPVLPRLSSLLSSHIAYILHRKGLLTPYPLSS